MRTICVYNCVYVYIYIYIYIYIATTCGGDAGANPADVFKNPDMIKASAAALAHRLPDELRTNICSLFLEMP